MELPTGAGAFAVVRQASILHSSRELDAAKVIRRKSISEVKLCLKIGAFCGAGRFLSAAYLFCTIWRVEPQAFPSTAFYLPHPVTVLFPGIFSEMLSPMSALVTVAVGLSDLGGRRGDRRD